MQLTYSSKDHVMHSMSNSINSTYYNNAREVFDALFESLRSRYQGIFETSMRESNVSFDSVQLIYYKSNKANFRRAGSYIDSLDRIKKKQKTINPKNENDTYFQYPITVLFNYGEIELHAERVANI